MGQTILITLAIAILAVIFLIVGLSITLMRKGHDLESDVGSNREMKKRGIECASAQIRREEAERLGRKEYLTSGCVENCEECGTALEKCEK